MMANSGVRILVPASIAFLFLAVGVSVQTNAVEMSDRGSPSTLYSQRRNTPERRCTPTDCYRDPPIELRPYLITPTSEELVLPLPVIRWMAVEGVDRYTITIEGSNLHWEESATQPWLRYDGQPLELGQIYLLTANAHNGEDPVSLHFTTIAPQNYHDMSDRIAEIDAPDGFVERIMVTVDIYLELGVYSEAINLLERSIPELEDNPEMYCQLALLYQEISQHGIAEEVIAESPTSNCEIPEN